MPRLTQWTKNPTRENLQNFGSNTQHTSTFTLQNSNGFREVVRNKLLKEGKYFYAVDGGVNSTSYTSGASGRRGFAEIFGGGDIVKSDDFRAPRENTQEFLNKSGPSVLREQFGRVNVQTVNSQSSTSNFRSTAKGIVSRNANTAAFAIGAGAKLAANWYTTSTRLAGEAAVLDTRQPTGEGTVFRTLQNQRDIDTIEAEKKANEANKKANTSSSIGEGIADAIGVGLSILPAFL